ncbi:hypothetical protein [Runella zeae]|uniref:hypothetical protein n=1 Tax=Runella zeae TaxID=94255 RepID=UPI00235429F0|nr:hypothetical protein [Runella zeae]
MKLTLMERFNAPMPKFFQTLFKIGGIVVAVGVGLGAAQESLVAQGLPVPEWLAYLVGAVGVVTSLISKFTVKLDK